MNAIQKMIYRNTQTVAETKMSELWNYGNVFLANRPTDADKALKLRTEIENDWDAVSKIIFNNETPDAIMQAVSNHSFSEGGEIVKLAVREQCKFAVQ